jgi:ATP-dependent HslUV protease ATP-binding subunit HslU
MAMDNKRNSPSLNKDGFFENVFAELDLTPPQIVAELDKYIVGQQAAKKAVAIALRNRYRRSLLPKEMQDEILPKNILMIGPTGVGKTEIARRLSRLAKAPFIKVEATKFTEVGYVGRDVESIIRDLVEMSVRMVKAERIVEVEDKAKVMAEERILQILVPSPTPQRSFNPLTALFGGGDTSSKTDHNEEHLQEIQKERDRVKSLLELGELENQMVEIEVDDQRPPVLEVFTGSGMEEMGMNLQDIFGNMIPKKKKKRKVPVSEARRILAQDEAQKLIDMDEVVSDAIKRAENSGIVFIDEIDKIAGGYKSSGPDVSREGVQRDILPIVEGSTIMTKYGPVKTDHILFIAAGAFHISKPSDLIPELQGRFPIRVELDSLSKEDFQRILTEPANALTTQQTSLLATEGVNVSFTSDGIDQLAQLAKEVNEQTEDIGARRLHTLMEKLFEEVSYNSLEYRGKTIVIDRTYVKKQLEHLVKDADMSRYIL